MPTRREYLISLGLAKPGRGKFSVAGNSAILAARDKGMVFDDDNKPAPKVKSENDKPKNSVPKPVGIISEITYTYPENAYRAFEKDTKKERSMRSVCMTCGVSLVVHGCLNPTIVSTDARGTVAVQIKPV